MLVSDHLPETIIVVLSLALLDFMSATDISSIYNVRTITWRFEGLAGWLVDPI